MADQNIHIPKSLRLHFYLTALCLIALPFGGLAVSYSIVLLVLNALYCFVVNKGYKNFKWSTKLISCIALYVLYVVGLLYTSNYHHASRDLETKLSLLFLPFVFCFFPSFDRKKFRSLSLLFIYVCLLAFVICLGMNYFKYGFEQPDRFFYSYLSIFIHPGYFSIYMSVAIALVAYLSSVEANDGRMNRALGVFLIICLLLAQVMLSAKMPMIVSFMLVIASVCIWLYRLNKIKAVLVFALIATTLVLVVTNIPSLSLRFHTVFETVEANEIDITTTESSKVRVLIWNASTKAIQDNIILGVGTGDVIDVLREYYKKDGYTGALEHNLNTHNQFLQTTLTLGMPGLAAIMLLFFNSIVTAWRKKDLLFLRFIFIFSVSCLTESVLETQAGVCAFALFNAIFLFSREK